MIEKIPLNSLKYFYYVATFNSVTLASQELHITQSAVSKQIKNLENTLGLLLFKRINKSLVLTKKGQTLFEVCEGVFAQLDSCLIELNKDAHINSKALVLSCEPTISMRWLIPRLTEFKALNYGFDVILLTAGGMIDFEKNGIDIALRRNDFNWSEHIYHEKIIDEHMLLVRSNRHKNNETILLSSSRPYLWKKNVKSGLLSNETLRYKRMELEHFYLCLEGCLSGMGSTIASIYMLEKELSYNLLEKNSQPVKDGSAYYLLSAEPFENDERKVIFKQWLKKEMEKTQLKFYSK